MARILSISYDEPLLTTRQQILESRRHNVTSIGNLAEALAACESTTRFDLLIIGHSIPHAQKEQLVQAFRERRPHKPVIALKRGGEDGVGGADLSIDPNPAELLDSVAKIISGRGMATS